MSVRRAVHDAAACSEPSALLALPEIPFTKFVLPNGLRLIVHEDRKAPIVAVNVWYHVGSKNELQDKTGFAHLFEHLMFNGSEHFDSDYFAPLEKVGATDVNGTTNNDRTNYFQTVPTPALDTALWMESDRMGHLLGAIDQAKLDEQRGVVQNEKRQGENRPYGCVRELLAANTYPKGHPYSWTVIGSMEDLDGATLDDVREWFRTYYGASNAVISIAGDIGPEDARERVEQFFGHIPPGPPIARHAEWIAKRTGTHRQRIQDRVPQARLYLTWNVPAWGAGEAQWLGLVGDILSQGKSARLYKRLVYDDQIATDVVAYPSLREIGGQFNIVATAKPGGDLAAIEDAINEELTRFVFDGPTDAELERATTQHIAGFVRNTERIGGFGGKSDVLAMSEVFGGSPDYYVQNLRAVTEARADDLRRAAEAWLTDGVYALEVQPYPKHGISESRVDRAAGVPRPRSAPIARFPGVQHAALDNGLDIAVVHRDTTPLVTMELLLPGGFAADGPSPGLTSLTWELLTEGTRRHTAFEISDELDRLGAGLHTFCMLDGAVVSLSAMKSNFDEALDVFAEVLLESSYESAAIDRKRTQRLAAIEQESASPSGIGYRLFPRLLYGRDHPYGRPLSGSGYATALSALAPEDFVAAYRTWVQPGSAALLAAGDTTADDVAAMLNSRFRDWKSGSAPAVHVEPVSPLSETAVYLVDRPGADQSYIFAGHVAPPRNDPEQPALETLNRMLGGAFTSRINMNLREDKHWTYGARSMFIDGRAQRMFVVTAPVQSDKTAESIVEIDREIRGVLGERPFTAAELDASKRNQVLRLAGVWETSGAVVRSLRDLRLYDLPRDYYDTYAARIEALTLDDVQRAAERVLQPARMVWLIVGDLSKNENDVRTLGLGNVQRVES